MSLPSFAAVAQIENLMIAYKLRKNAMKMNDN